MTEQTYTTGPLSIDGPSPGGTPCDDGGDYAIMDEHGYIIGEAINLVWDGRFAPAKANATLWAHAAELLEQLAALTEITREYFGDEQCDHDVNICFCGIKERIAAAEAAMKKARGEE